MQSMDIGLPFEVYMKARDTECYIPMQELKADHAYLISARNAYVGIWNPEVNAFVISREKDRKSVV